MNKKGYLRILESVLAIIIVFSFILFILPKKDVNLIKVDPELESTVETIAKQIERQTNMRNCVISSSDSTNCINEYIKNNIKPQSASWEYGIKIFELNADGTINADITSQNYPQSIDIILNSIGSDVYTKNFIIAAPDLTEGGTTEPGNPTDPPDKLVRLLFWSKQ